VGLREPVQEVAEPEAIVKLVTQLQNIEVVDFLDGGPPDRTGLDHPVATLTIESDQRDPDGTVHTSLRTLVVGQQADIAGKSVFASVQRGAESRLVTVGAEGLASLTTDPAAYVSRRTLSTPESEVGKVEVVGQSTHSYARGIDGWKDSAGGALTPQDADALQSVLALLAKSPADSVATGDDWPLSWGPKPGTGALVRLSSLGGAPIGEVRVAISPGTTGRPATRCGAVWRLYPPSAGAAASWLLR
jgi:hypothetical protein